MGQKAKSARLHAECDVDISKKISYVDPFGYRSREEERKIARVAGCTCIRAEH